MTKRKRKKYGQEFKEEAVKLVTEQGYQVSEAARNLGVHPNMLSRWKREILGDDESSFLAPLMRHVSLKYEA